MSDAFFKYVSLKETLFSKLSYDESGRLLLGNVIVLIIPRRIFSIVQRSISDMLGEGCAALVMYNAGYSVGYDVFAKTVKRFNNDTKSAFEFFITVLTTRGWGDFKIVKFNENDNTYYIRVSSSYGEDLFPSNRAVCHFIRGLLTGSLQCLVDLKEKGIKLYSREVKCIAKGDPYCEFLIAEVKKFKS